MEARLKLRAEYVKKEAARALELSVEEGAVALQDNLEAAETKTGRARVSSGRGQFAGRHDSGNMVGGVSHNGDRQKRSGKITWASFGWFSGDFEDYMRSQDLGEGNIPAARAMNAAFVVAREAFLRRMRAVVRGRDFD